MQNNLQQVNICIGGMIKPRAFALEEIWDLGRSSFSRASCKLLTNHRQW